MNQLLFDFSDPVLDKKYFFFSVLNYPHELLCFSSFKNRPNFAPFIQIEDESNALLYLLDKHCSKAQDLLALAKNNEGKTFPFLTYDQIFIF